MAVILACVGCGRIGFDRQLDGATGDTGSTAGSDSPGSAGACATSPALVQSLANGNGQQGGPLTWSTSAVAVTATKAGSTLICCNWHKTAVANDPIVSFTDDKNDVYTQVGATIVENANNYYDLWYLTNAPAGIHGWRVTLQTADTGYYNDEQCWEYANIPAGAADATSSGTVTSDASRSATLAPVTTTQAGDVLHVAFNQAGGHVTDAAPNYTLYAASDNSKYASKLGSAAGIETVVATTANADQQILTYWVLAFRCTP